MMIPKIMDKKLRMLAAGCIHGDTNLVQKLVTKAQRENVDIVLLCGDTLGDINTQNLIKPFKDINKPVLLITGNHEGIPVGDFLADYYKIKHLHGSYAVYNEVGLFGCSAANVGIDALSDNDFFETLEKGFEKVKNLDKKVMITHVHPSESSLESVTGFSGSAGIKKAIDKFQPDILFCSHLHEMAGFEEKIGKTRVINVSRIGKIVEL